MQFGGHAAGRDFKRTLFDDRTERRIEKRQRFGRYVERHGAAAQTAKENIALSPAIGRRPLIRPVSSV